MTGCTMAVGRRKGGSIQAIGSAMLLIGLLSACSSVPDAANPVEWYKGATDFVTGRDRQEIANPRAPQGKYADLGTELPREAPKGLVADRNAKYAPPVAREVGATKPLARSQPAEVAQAPAAAVTKQGSSIVIASPHAASPASVGRTQVAQAAAVPPPSPDRRLPTARDLGPAAPPASPVNMVPPARPDIPESVPLPAQGRARKPIEEQYALRLSESAQTGIRPDMVRGGGLAALSEPVHLVPPKSMAGRGRGVAVAQPVELPAATFQIAAVDFAGGGTSLTAEDMKALVEVAKLHKQTGGTIRVVGRSPAPRLVLAGAGVDAMMSSLETSMQRANAVAHELTRRGVPATKVFVGADTSNSVLSDNAGAQIFIDY
ncbi:MAG: hypothetical protein HY985_02700 [Magnetospirillum sp.]|nr:hypothetical protein [Magnetospirillum sp.]